MINEIKPGDLFKVKEELKKRFPSIKDDILILESILNGFPNHILLIFNISKNEYFKWYSGIEYFFDSFERIS